MLWEKWSIPMVEKAFVELIDEVENHVFEKEKKGDSY